MSTSTDKVTVEITPKGWKLVLNYNGKQFIQNWKRDEFGFVADSSFDDNELIPDWICEAIDELSIPCTRIADELCLESDEDEEDEDE